MKELPAFLVLFAGFIAVTIAVAVSTDGGGGPGGAPANARGVFFTIDAPALTSDELAVLGGLVRVDSVAALDDALGEETALLVIDASAIDVLPAGYLARRFAEGRAIMGVNVFGSELAEDAGYPNRAWPSREQWAQSHDGHGEGAFYSYMFRSPPGRDIQQSGGGQHHFKDRLLPGVLQQLLEGGWWQ